MRQDLLVVLVLGVSCICTSAYGEQATSSEQGMLEQSTLSPHRSIPFSRAVYAMSYAHNRLRPINELLALHITFHVHERRPESRRLAHVSPLSHGHTSQLDTRNVLTLEKSKFDSMHPLLQTRHVRMLPRDRPHWLGKDDVELDDSKHVRFLVKHVLSHNNAMRRMSLLDVVDGSTADKQANSVRRQGIDSALLRYAALILSADTQTGAVYDFGLPPSLSGIRAQVIRIIPATFHQVGLILNEFEIPTSASFSPSGDYVALVYRKISSFTMYSLPPEYQFGGPVVGIMSSSSNSTTIDPSLTPGSINLPDNNYINISLPVFSKNPNGDTLCAFFASNGSIFVSNLASVPSYCLSSTLGDFALVIKASSTTSPTQGVSPPTPTAPPNEGSTRSPSSPNAKSSVNWKLIVGATCLALAGLAFLVAVVLISIKFSESVKRFLATRHYGGNDEALQDSLVGDSIAPSAAVLRTKPALEIDVAHFSH